MRKINKILCCALSCILVLPLVTACTKNANQFITRNDWDPEVKSSLNALISKNSNSGKYVVFDFDNTSCIFDIEDQLMIYQLKTMAFEIKPEMMRQVLLTSITEPDKTLSNNKYFNGSFNDIITDITTAYSKLWDSYGPFSAKGLTEDAQNNIQQDKYWKEFVTKMYTLTNTIIDVESPSVGYAWVQHWYTGMTENELYDLAMRSHNEYKNVDTYSVELESPSDITSNVGQVEAYFHCGISVTDNIKELWKSFAENGIDVWVCSASPIDVVRAAVDCFGLHDYCRGVLGMIDEVDSNNKFINKSDNINGRAYLCEKDETWTKTSQAQKVQPYAIQKVIAIQNVIMPLYNNNGPIAGFMDSTGDYNFCTEFSSLQLVVCFNRADRKVTDGGGLISEVCKYQKDHLNYNFNKAQEAGDTLYVLQGRDENGKRTFRNSSNTVVFESDQEKLFCNQDNYKQYEFFCQNNLSTKDIINRFCIKTSSDDSVLGFDYGFLTEYRGYHTL